MIVYIQARAAPAASRAAPRATGGAGRAATNGSGGMGAAAQAQIEDLNNQMMEMKLTVEGLEKERDFYFGKWNIHCKIAIMDYKNVTAGKLRDVEVMCQECEGQGGDVVRKVKA